MVLQCLILLAFLGATSSAVVPDPVNTCSSVLRSYGFSKSYDAAIAHSIHSMTVNELRKFDPSATEKNFVPTVNRDLKSGDPILHYAPDVKSADDAMFLTEGMKTLDLVLSHMNDKTYGVASFTPLERVAHDFHMKETWARAKVEFDKIGHQIPKPSPQVCQCALDIENNGILKAMFFGNKALREEKRFYVFSERLVGFLESYKDFKEGKDVFAEEPAQTYPLVNTEAWDFWKSKSFTAAHEAYRDLAMFLYCAIEKAHTSSA